MLATTINSYLYQQYADDDSLQAFVLSYNVATQTIVTWLATTNLAYYPGLTGDLLTWVAANLYGVERAALETQPTGNFGPLNTEALYTAPLNSFIPSAQSSYAMTDDVLQRILTWNFYKGDGNRFTMLWLKRRIMRFLTGTNGIDQNPWTNPNFTVGAETLSAISAHISGTTLTVNINQALLSSQAQIAPNILLFFQLAFQSGVLELPAELTSLVCNIQTTLVATASPASLVIVQSLANYTSPPTSVSLEGGSGSYTYAWAFTSGGAGITITSPTAGSTTFSTTGLAYGSSVSGTATCTVTDTITTHVATVSVPVSLARGSVPIVSISPASITLTGTGSNILTQAAMASVSPGSGKAPYTYAWSWQSGGTGITIDTAAAATTAFTATGILPGQTFSGTAQCAVTDSFGTTVNALIPISITCATLVTMSVSSTSQVVNGATAVLITGFVTGSAAGGVGPYTYSWAWASGGAGITILDPANPTTDFETTAAAPGTSYTGNAVCTAKDSLGQYAQATCGIIITRASLITAAVSPATQTSSSSATTQTTGFSTATATGGSGTYTYAWAWASSGSHISINSASSNRTSFTGSSMVAGNTYTGVARCTITDGYLQIATVTVSVSITCGGVFNGSLVAGEQFDDTVGHINYYFVGYSSPGYGTLTPHIDQNGNTIVILSYAQQTRQLFLIMDVAANPGQNYFTTLTVGADSYASASAIYSYSGGQATWLWSSASPITNTDTYAVQLA
jgi:hypothetical protein